MCLSSRPLSRGGRKCRSMTIDEVTEGGPANRLERSPDRDRGGGGDPGRRAGLFPDQGQHPGGRARPECDPDQRYGRASCVRRVLRRHRRRRDVVAPRHFRHRRQRVGLRCDPGRQGTRVVKSYVIASGRRSRRGVHTGVSHERRWSGGRRVDGGGSGQSGSCQWIHGPGGPWPRSMPLAMRDTTSSESRLPGAPVPPSRSGQAAMGRALTTRRRVRWWKTGSSMWRALRSWSKRHGSPVHRRRTWQSSGR